MRILITGGYGNISWWCTKYALDLGNEVFVLNRELTTSTRREIPSGVNILNADYRDFKAVEKEIAPYTFDVVCDFLCMNSKHAEAAYELFKNKTKHYILISTESVYKRGCLINEYSPKYDLNETSSYISGKLQAEEFFKAKYLEEKFPLTIVCPGYTLDTILPYSIGQNCYTVAQRYLDGKPILIAGDGNKKWTFTHSSDFAYPFCKLIENKDTIGERFNIIGDTVSTFNNIMGILAKALVNKEPDFLHIPDCDCLKLFEFMPEDLMKQRLEEAVFDNSKIKSIVSDWKTTKNAEQIVVSSLDWLNENPVRKRFNKELDIKLEKLTQKYKG